MLLPKGDITQNLYLYLFFKHFSGIIWHCLHLHRDSIWFAALTQWKPNVYVFMKVCRLGVGSTSSKEENPGSFPGISLVFPNQIIESLTFFHFRRQPAFHQHWRVKFTKTQKSIFGYATMHFWWALRGSHVTLCEFEVNNSLNCVYLSDGVCDQF